MVARTIRALIMAGGRSDRMRVTSGVHKALMPFRGQPLIAHNLHALMKEGFRDVVVATSPLNPEIDIYLSGAGLQLAESFSASLNWFKEETPLGTIGAAKLAAEGVDALLVINVDNLSTLPLGHFVEWHLQRSSDFTIASHTESFRIPFGQLVIQEDEVVAYLEKPAFPIPISSGTYVLGPKAIATIEPGIRFDIPRLFETAKLARLKVCAFSHNCPWIDINDEPALQRADTLFSRSDVRN